MWVRWALDATAPAVVRVHACVGLAAIVPVAIAILHSGVAHWGALAVAATGGAVRVRRALGVASAAVVRIRSYIGLATICPVTIAIRPTCVAHWGALAIVAAGGAVRVGGALDATAPAVVRVLACVGFTAIVPVAIAILHSRVAHWGALAVAAAGGAVRVRGALGIASAAVVRIRSYIGLATICPVTIAIRPTCVAHWGALAIVAAGGAVRVGGALDATAPAVVRVLACVGFTAIVPVAIAILHSWVARWGALAVAAAGGAVRVCWALCATAAAVHGIVVNICFTSILWVGIAVLKSWSTDGTAGAPGACGSTAGVGWTLVSTPAAVVDIVLGAGFAGLRVLLTFIVASGTAT